MANLLRSNTLSLSKSCGTLGRRLITTQIPKSNLDPATEMLQFDTGFVHSGRGKPRQPVTPPPASGRIPPSPRSTRREYFLHVHASPNNTMLHFTDGQGQTLKNGIITAGQFGFTNAQRNTFDAGHQCAVKMLRRIEEEAQLLTSTTPGGLQTINMDINMVFQGRGQGKDAIFQALMTAEGDVVRPLIRQMEDRTKIKIGGTRAMKKRRL
ncbi:hypothetical protein FRC03_001263 [Tulasnella sp. 419]|nr:hypothetical protein FRC02_004845 [Tulasnella sp. 418]KAG8964874.1 hypothetical protein FRC03_001263 [Tulasnella sp. 419]